jgi:predicted GNAT family acetyltransferase
MSDTYSVTNNTAAHRFEVEIEGELAVLEYAESATAVDLRHTEVPPALGSRGVGAALVEAGLEYAEQQGKRVIPTCPFVRSYVARHPKWNAIVTTEK